MERLMTVFEVAEVLALKPATIRKMIFQRRVPVTRIGRAVRMREKDIQALIDFGYRPGLDGTSQVMPKAKVPR